MFCEERTLSQKSIGIARHGNILENGVRRHAK